MKKSLAAGVLTTTILLTAFVVGSAITNGVNMALAASTSQECKDGADKISSKADASQSGNVCGIELSRDSPTLTLNGKKINDQVPMEFPYQPASASSGKNVLELAEFTLLQSEVNKVNQYLEDHHWTVTAIHNHQFFEHPTLIYMHAQKQDNRDSILQDIRNALKKTSCGCV
jgi:hypothetical protein